MSGIGGARVPRSCSCPPLLLDIHLCHLCVGQMQLVWQVSTTDSLNSRGEGLACAFINLFGGYPPAGWTAGHAPARTCFTYNLPAAVIADVMKAR